MRKLSRRLNALQLFFLVVGGSLVGCMVMVGVAVASAPFDDDFDTYPVNQALSGQGGWVCSGATTLVKNTESESVPNSVLNAAGENCYRRDGSSVADGEVYFSVKTDAHTGGWASFSLLKSNETTSYAIVAWSSANGTLTENYTGTSDWGTMITGWNLIGIKWHYEATPGNRYFQVSLNGSDFVSGSLTFNAYVLNGTILDGAITGYSIGNGQGDYFDSITGTAPTPPVITGYGPVLTPTVPPRNVETVVDFDDSVAASGTIAIPTNNTHAYDNLKVLFYKPNNAFPAQTLNIPISLTGGQSYAYSATTTIAVSGSGNNFFKVAYNLSGRTYVGSYADNPVISMPLLPFDNTWIKDSVSSAPASILNQATLPTQEALEDCDAYSGIDAVICRFKNFIMGAFLPSNDALAQISGTMDALKTKFPMNYASAVSSSFGTIAAGVDDNSGFTFSLYGHSGTADTSFFTQDLGSGITIGGSIKLILTFLVFMLFLAWGINYMHRVLPK